MIFNRSTVSGIVGRSNRTTIAEGKDRERELTYFLMGMRNCVWISDEKEGFRSFREQRLSVLNDRSLYNNITRLPELFVSYVLLFSRLSLSQLRDFSSSS